VLPTRQIEKAVAQFTGPVMRSTPVELRIFANVRQTEDQE
jgi:hypothetical protein